MTSSPRPRSATIQATITSTLALIKTIFKNNMAITIPLLIVLLILAGALGVISMIPAISPFVYPLL